MRVVEERVKTASQFGSTSDLKRSERAKFLVDVNPADAAQLLAQMHPQQRLVSHRVVNSFVGLMRKGKFLTPSSPGIYVDREGRVCNARHRLLAQVATGLTLRWEIVLGASPEEIQILDQVRPRQIHQSINLTTDAKPMNHREEAVLRQYLNLETPDGKLSQDYEKLSVDDILAVRDLFSDDVQWALRLLPVKTAVASVVAVAAWTRPLDPTVVEPFFDVFQKMRNAQVVSIPEDHPAAALCRYINHIGVSRTTKIATNEIIEKTLTALYAHFNGAGIKKIYVRQDILKWFQDQRRMRGLSTR